MLKLLLIAILLITSLSGQIQGQILHPTTPLPTFDVATIKPSRGDETIPSRTSSSESLTVNVTVRNLIEKAFNVPWTPTTNDRVLGGPNWIDSDRFDIDARVDDAAFAALSNDARKQQIALMLQSLLADRFDLKYHFESRTLPVYELQPTKDGPKLTPAQADQSAIDPSAPLPPDPKTIHHGLTGIYDGQTATMTARSATIDDLVHWLSGYSEIGGRPILNQTSLPATYDFTLTWTRTRLTSEPPPTTTGPEPDSLFTAIQKQLGLHLVSARAPVEVIVIGHVIRPTPN